MNLYTYERQQKELKSKRNNSYVVILLCSLINIMLIYTVVTNNSFDVNEVVYSTGTVLEAFEKQANGKVSRYVDLIFKSKVDIEDISSGKIIQLRISPDHLKYLSVRPNNLKNKEIEIGYSFKTVFNEKIRLVKSIKVNKDYILTIEDSEKVFKRGRLLFLSLIAMISSAILYFIFQVRKLKSK